MKTSIGQEKRAGWEDLGMLEWTNIRLLTEARTLLALGAVLVVKITLPESTSGPIPALLTLYAVYSAIILLLTRSARVAVGVRFAYWVDCSIYLAVVAISGGMASSYWLFLLFPVLAVSSQFGYRHGALLAAGCTLLVFAMEPVQVWQGLTGANHAVLWSVALLPVIGLVVARWGHQQFTLVRGLALANDLNGLSNPCHTLPHAMVQLATILRAYYRADACIVILNDPQTGKALSYEARQESTDGLPTVSAHSEDGLRSLLALAAGSGIAYCRRRHFWQRTVANACDVSERQSLDCNPDELSGLADLLGTDSFLSLPIGRGHRVLGRLYLISRCYSYGHADLQFLQYMLRPTALIVENIQLLDRLTSEVTTQERQRISRDLHDGTIQPYIGLKLGLEALRRAVPGDSAIAMEIDELSEMAKTGIAELRRYVATLRSDPDVASGTESLTAGVRRLAKRFSEFYGVDVSVRAESDVPVNRHLFNELMNIVREGLSNIRRHTPARRATIALYRRESRLTMEFGNDGVGSERGATGFFPRSIAERARELGGRVNVEQNKIGDTTVAVEIPV